METSTVIVLIAACLGTGAVLWVWTRHRARRSTSVADIGAVHVEPSASIYAGLRRTRESLTRLWREPLSQGGALRDTLEEALLRADVGLKTTSILLDRVFSTQEGNEAIGAEQVRQKLKAEVVAMLRCGVPADVNSERCQKPCVISFVGVNGAGKTTTVGKLAAQLHTQGKSVLLGAVDTFRAAAAEQLQVWAERAEAQVVAGREGGDPGAVAFDAVAAGKARAVDYVLLDTAGRLHTKVNLISELARVHNVVKKVIPEAPHEIWLVVDGTLGQNSVRQAEEFNRTLALSGVVVTKLDGTAKGGAVIAIAHDLGLPVRYIGVGEKVGDLKPFDAVDFADAIFGTS